MDRPPRKTKAVNYCDTKDFDDEDDFACAPPSKRMKDGGKNTDPKKSSSKSSSQDSNSELSQGLKKRKPLDEKLLDRDLEAAVALSLLNNSVVNEQSSHGEGDAAKTPVDESSDLLPPVLSKFWEDTPREDSSVQDVTAPTLTDLKKSPKEDDDYCPRPTPESESDEDFSEQESDDEEFTEKKVKKTSKKEMAVKNEKPKQTKAVKKGKQTMKTPPTASAIVRSPPAAKPADKGSAPPSTASSSKPVVPLSPAGAKIPKWTPPGQVGKSPLASPGSAVKSPGQGLRLGLSRRVRVKPLHPGVGNMTTC